MMHYSVLLTLMPLHLVKTMKISMNSDTFLKVTGIPQSMEDSKCKGITFVQNLILISIVRNIHTNIKSS